MNTKLQTNGALLTGRVIRRHNVITGELLCDFPENRERLLGLASNYRLRAHSDGWFVDGKGHRSQIWEFGIAKLGLTVIGPKFVRKCLAQSRWLTPKSVGDREANFFCAWSDDNLANLQALTGLQQRRRPPSAQGAPLP